MHDKTLILLTLLFFHLFSYSQNLSNKQLKSYIESNKSFSNSFVGVSVYSINSQKEVLAYNSDKNFTPASVLKLFYTLSAIDLKGKGYRFTTQFYYTGEIIFDGTLTGDLLILPSGDPTLGSPRFYKEGYFTIMKRIKDMLLNSDITCIEGDIILIIPNQSYPIHGSWTTEDLGNYYAGGAWALNINDNEYKIKIKLNKSLGDLTEIYQIKPKIPFLKIENNVKMGIKNSGDQSYIYGIPFSYSREIKGTLPLGKNYYTIKGSIPNPPLTFLNMLSDYLEEQDIYFRNVIINKNNIKNKKYLFEIKSPKLIDITKTCNNYSVNLYSESLLRLLSLKSDYPKDYISESEIKSIFSKYNIKGTQIVDGCGLSSKNLISPKHLNEFINTMIKRLGIYTVLDILPKAGVEGYAKSISIPDLWIKSGSIQGVLNYSGIYIKDGNYYIFSIMTNNNYEKKKIRKNIFNLLKLISSNK